jgi:hypothetical protein
MSETKIVSVRIPYEKYEEYLLECESLQIGISELVHRKMAIANSTKKIKKEIADGIENVLEVFEDNPTIAKFRLKNLLRKVGK